MNARDFKSEADWLIFRQLRNRSAFFIKSQIRILSFKTTEHLNDPKKKIITCSYRDKTTNEMPAFFVKDGKM